MVRSAAVATVVTMMGLSAFAESRPSNETRERREGSTNIRRDGATEHSEARAEPRSERPSRNGSIERGERRERVGEPRSDRGSSRDSERREGIRNREDDSREEHRGSVDRRQARGGDRDWDRNRGDDSRHGGSWRNDRRYDRDHRGGHHGNRTPYYAHGRISRMHRHGSGWRVWVLGAPYPFFVPGHHYRHDRFRVGLSIHLGGYYNPRGYYDYYDGYSDSRYSRGEIRGTVESVDRRRDTFVVRNEETGSFVTVINRDRRRDLRVGDYVEISGDWTRSGLFTAYDVDLLDDRYARYDD